MTADKPEAGRTCKEWCGDGPGSRGCVGSGEECFGGYSRCYCSEECREAGRPLNPSPHPVEPTCDGNPHVAGCAAATAEAPRPVERCSCDESVALRKALMDAIATLEAAPVDENEVCPMGDEEPCGLLPKYRPCWNHRRSATIDIARRALALGREE